MYPQIHCAMLESGLEADAHAATAKRRAVCFRFSFKLLFSEVPSEMEKVDGARIDTTLVNLRSNKTVSNPKQ